MEEVYIPQPEIAMLWSASEKEGGAKEDFYIKEFLSRGRILGPTSHIVPAL